MKVDELLKALEFHVLKPVPSKLTELSVPASLSSQKSFVFLLSTWSEETVKIPLQTIEVRLVPTRLDRSIC